MIVYTTTEYVEMIYIYGTTNCCFSSTVAELLLFLERKDVDNLSIIERWQRWNAHANIFCGNCKKPIQFINAEKG